MASLAEHTHAFLVRIWREPRDAPDAPPEWRGSIEHLPSGARRYVNDLDGLIDFITPYLKSMGGRIAERGWEQRCLAWIQGTRRRRRKR